MPELTFEDRPLDWPEAEAAFVQRLQLPADVYYELAEEYRGLAFTVRRIATLQALARIKRRLEQAIANGETLQAFQAWADRLFPGWSKAYTELVFRQATLSSSAAGRWTELTDPDTAEEFPYWMYDAVDDDRTRETHAKMDGKAWPRDEFPDEWVPPNGFQCRCDIRQLNEDLLRRSGAKLQEQRPDDEPDEGFRANQNRTGELRQTLEQELERVRAKVQQ
jgi:SPP1 gp7 family putative phage head morphogenesis protein